MASKTLDPIDILLELGIDLDDLSEQDYLSALMEAIATIEFQTKGKGDDRSAVLREEVIKIRKGKRKPQAKKTKISADMLRPTPKLMGTADKINPSKLLPPSQEESTKEPEQDSIIKILTDISESVKSILYSLKASNNISKNLAEDERKRRETKKRTGAENKLEKKRFEGLKKIGNKLIEPIKGPLEALFNFLKNVILGRIVIGIIDWLGNPENQKKLESLGRFFMDWWPTIVTAVLLFGTGLGGLLKSIVGITFKFIPKLLGLLPGLLKFLKSPMGRIAGLAVAGAGLAGRMMDGGEDDVDLTKGDTPAKTTPAAQTTPTAPAQTETPAPAPQTGGKTPYERATEAGYEVIAANDGYILYENKKTGVTKTKSGTFRLQGETKEERFNNYFDGSDKFRTLKLKGGGQVPGSGPNKDTVPAMLAPGEFVMSRGAVQKYGSSTLASMNAAGGGTNLPERVNGITYAAGGGMMGDGGKEKISPKLSSEMKKRDRVIGRENLPPATRAILEKMDAQRAGNLPPDIKTTGPLLGRLVMGSGLLPEGLPGMGGGGGGTNALTNQAKVRSIPGMLGSLFNSFRKKEIDPQTILENVKSKAKNMVTSMGGTVLDSNSQEQNMKRVMALPPEMREAVLADMARTGGEVKESSGQNFAGGTADRQLIKAQPGEYMLPVDTVNKLGGPARLDQLVANTDSNSTPAKLGMRSKQIPQVGPPIPNQPRINLIPTKTGGSKGYGNSSGSALPNFDAGIGDPNKAKLLGVIR